MDRRQFLATSAAAAVIAAVPAITTEATAMAKPRAGYWGMSHNDDLYYELCASSREDAIAEALSQYPEGDVAIAWCEPVPVTARDLRDGITNWMCGDGKSIEYMIVDEFECGIEDADYEGDMATELCRADRAQVSEDVRAALNAALARAGRIELIGRDFCEDPIDSKDPVLLALDKDEILGAETVAAGQRWFERINLEGSGSRTLQTSQEHYIPEVEST